MSNVIELIDVTICQANGNRKNNKDIVLSDINLRVGAGELVYLLGSVGSGKSTLLKSLYGEIPLAKGEGYIADYSLHKLKTSEIPYLRRRLGIVFQDFQLLPDRDVFENLSFFLRATGWTKNNEIKKRIEHVLDMVDLSHKSYKRPHHLSQGEQQRLAIARALINNPEIILADEPTGNLDPNISLGIINLFFEIAKSGTTVILATHDKELFESYPSRTIVCRGGKVEELTFDEYAD